MYALVEELAAAGKVGIRAPFFVVTWTAAVAVDRAEEHEGTDGATLAQLVRAPDGGMVAVVEAGLQDHSGLPGCFNHRLCLLDVAAQWFLTEHVLPCLTRGNRDRRQDLVDRRDDHDIHIVSCHHILPVGRPGASGFLGHLLCATGVCIGDDDDLVAQFSRHRGPAFADQPAADDANCQRPALNP